MRIMDVLFGQAVPDKSKVINSLSCKIASKDDKNR